MNIIDKSDAIVRRRPAISTASGCAGSSKSFRPDELEVRSGATDLADVAQALEGNPRAVLFEAAGPERQQLVGNVTGSRSRIAHAFGVAPNELLREIQRPPAQQAGDRRSLARRGAGAAGGADRRRRRPHRAAGASPARRRRRALHLRVDRFRRRSEDRLDQCRHPPPDAARPHRGRRRPQLAERPARDLRGERRRRQAGAGRASWSARIRSIISPR